MASILVVEDYRDSRTVIELILRDAHHQVYSAPDGAAGVQAAAKMRPDVILMDLAMPNMDGWEAARQLKADPSTRGIPIIAFTAQVDPEALELAARAGCVSVLTKPFEIDELLRQIDLWTPHNHAVSA
ncbi:MAG: response regulator [Roseiflexaceae bacterium]|nr:response regulator [Roseiflexaceae bacterium]